MEASEIKLAKISRTLTLYSVLMPLVVIILCIVSLKFGTVSFLDTTREPLGNISNQIRKIIALMLLPLGLINLIFYFRQLFYSFHFKIQQKQFRPFLLSVLNFGCCIYLYLFIKAAWVFPIVIFFLIFCGGGFVFFLQIMTWWHTFLKEILKIHIDLIGSLTFILTIFTSIFAIALLFF